MIVTATKPEYQSFLDYDYFYDENVVKLTGFPRYDRLYHSEKKQIVILLQSKPYLHLSLYQIRRIVMFRTQTSILNLKTTLRIKPVL